MDTCKLHTGRQKLRSKSRTLKLYRFANYSKPQMQQQTYFSINNFFLTVSLNPQKTRISRNGPQILCMSCSCLFLVSISGGSGGRFPPTLRLSCMTISRLHKDFYADNLLSDFLPCLELKYQVLIFFTLNSCLCRFYSCHVLPNFFQ